MKRCVALLGLLPLAATAATWVHVSSTEVLKVYMDADSLRNVGPGVVTVWELNDNRVVGQDGELSYSSMLRIDCARRQVGTITIIDHEGSFGGGKVINRFDFDEVEMRPFPSGSSYESRLEFACGLSARAPWAIELVDQARLAVGGKPAEAPTDPK